MIIGPDGAGTVEVHLEESEIVGVQQAHQLITNNVSESVLQKQIQLTRNVLKNYLIETNVKITSLKNDQRCFFKESL